MHYYQKIAFLLWAVGVGITLLGTLFALFRPKKTRKAKELYPVSILKPLKGIDVELSQNLESFFKLQYPSFELLFSVQSETDPAVIVVGKLLRKYPHIQAQLLICQEELGPNPKVNNMLSSYEKAIHDCILISDSNVRVEENYLNEIVSSFGKDVGMVTAVVAGTNERGVGGNLEAMFLNTFYARWMYLLFGVGKACVVGKCMLFRKSTMKRIGGIKTLARYLAEDYMAGEAIRKLGLKVNLCPQPVNQYIGENSLAAFWSRHMRWGRIRKSQVFLAFCIEPIFLCIPSCVIGSWAACRLFTIHPVAFALVHLGLWCSLDLIMTFLVRSRIRPNFVLVWFFRELSAFPLWLAILSGNSVQWRGKTLTLESGGLLKAA